MEILRSLDGNQHVHVQKMCTPRKWKKAVGGRDSSARAACVFPRVCQIMFCLESESMSV